MSGMNWPFEIAGHEERRRLEEENARLNVRIRNLDRDVRDLLAAFRALKVIVEGIEQQREET
jgi:hypothetical protein